MRKLESLEAWKVGKEVSRAAYRLTMHKPLKHHLRLADQIRGAAISIPANIAEGYGSGTTAQLIRYSRISLGSTYELICHIETARDFELIDEVNFDELNEKLRRLVGLLIGLLNHLRAKVPRDRRR